MEIRPTRRPKENITRVGMNNSQMGPWPPYPPVTTRYTAAAPTTGRMSSVASITLRVA